MDDTVISIKIMGEGGSKRYGRNKTSCGQWLLKLGGEYM